MSGGWVAAPVVLVLALLPAIAGAADYSVEVLDEPVPSEVAAAIRAELAPRAIRVTADGDVLCEIWLRASWPSGPAGGGLSRSYPGLPDMALLGAIRVVGSMRDNRDNQFRQGVYTIRHGLQPQDGNHVGASEYIDFAVLLDAGKDTSVDGGFSDPMAMIYQSLNDGGTGHPVVFAMIPPGSGTPPGIRESGHGRWALEARIGDRAVAIEIVGYYEH